MIHPKGTFSLDVGNDGSIDIKGVYKWKLEKTKLTLITVSDECENRGALVGESMVSTRM